MIVVANATPLIYLAAIGEFDRLRVLYGQIAIPMAAFQWEQLPVGQAVLVQDPLQVFPRLPLLGSSSATLRVLRDLRGSFRPEALRMV